jgi:hypothetical protein
VVYGTELDKITGRVKLSVVGYGRKTEQGGDTLGDSRDWLIEAWFFGILPLVYRFVLGLGRPSLGVFGRCEVGFRLGV